MRDVLVAVWVVVTSFEVAVVAGGLVLTVVAVHA